MNTEEFKEALERHLAKFSLERGCLLHLAPNVFLAQTRGRDWSCDRWRNVYYYSASETKVRDQGQDIIWGVRLLIEKGFSGNVRLSEDPDDHARIAFLEDDTMDNLRDILIFGKEIFVGVDGEELPWFDTPSTALI